MTLIEEKAVRPVCPCIGCNGEKVCDDAARERCNAFLQYRQWNTKDVYQEHLEWMENMCRIKGGNSESKNH